MDIDKTLKVLLILSFVVALATLIWWVEFLTR